MDTYRIPQFWDTGWIFTVRFEFIVSLGCSPRCSFLNTQWIPTVSLFLSEGGYTPSASKLLWAVDTHRFPTYLKMQCIATNTAIWIHSGHPPHPLIFEYTVDTHHIALFVMMLIKFLIRSQYPPYPPFLKYAYIYGPLQIYGVAISLFAVDPHQIPHFIEGGYPPSASKWWWAMETHLFWRCGRYAGVSHTQLERGYYQYLLRPFLLHEIKNIFLLSPLFHHWSKPDDEKNIFTTEGQILKWLGHVQLRINIARQQGRRCPRN